MMRLSKRLMKACAICLVLGAGCGGDEGGQNAVPDYADDVQTLCDTMPAKYAYFESRSGHWGAACADALGKAQIAEGPAQALGILERLIDELYDAHIGFNTNSACSPRVLPSGADIWFQKHEEAYRLTAIRAGSSAGQKGLELGDAFVSFNGLPAEALARTRMHIGLDSVSIQRFEWAFHAALAGNRGAPRILTIMRDGVEIEIDLGEPVTAQNDRVLTLDMLTANIGHIRFHNSLGDGATVDAFNEAIEVLKGSQGLILDLRDTPGGGNTDVAEPIIGRFISKARPYQVTVPIGEEPIYRNVQPTGKWTYEKPVIVLVGRWTGSMGEGMAVGFDGLGRAVIMGDHMAGLALMNMGINLRYPAYGLNHIDGTPRHEWEPDIPRSADFGDQEDLLLKDAVAALSLPVKE